jgi:glycosyltransferase involved in cell wall biosynthesis
VALGAARGPRDAFGGTRGAGSGGLMRIVYVSTIDHGGPVSHVLDLAPRIAARDHDVHVICANDAIAARFRALGLGATPVPVRSKWDARGGSDFWALVAGADVVHTQDRRAGLFGRVLARARSIPVVHTYHGLPEEIAVELGDDAYRDPTVHPARRAWLRYGYLRIEAMLAYLGVVVTPSHAMARYLIGAGVPRGRIRVIPSGADVVREEPPPTRHDPAIVIAMGNLEVWKGVDVLLEACARLPLAARVELYGDGAARASLEAQAARLGVDARFHGHVRGSRDALLDADVLALPSRADNLPVTVLEAMAAAVPVVASRVGGVPELVDDGVTGMLVARDDVNGLAAALTKVLSDDALRVSMGRAGAARVRALFSADDVTDRFLDLYAERCASSR